MKNLKISKKMMILALTGITLTGCGNRKVLDTKYTFNKAIILSDDSATIIEIESWQDYEDGEQIQITTKDGLTILTSSFDTKLIDDRKSNISAEEVAYSILGSDAEINYLNNEEKGKAK